MWWVSSHFLVLSRLANYLQWQCCLILRKENHPPYRPALPFRCPWLACGGIFQTDSGLKTCSLREVLLLYVLLACVRWTLKITITNVSCLKRLWHGGPWVLFKTARSKLFLWPNSPAVGFSLILCIKVFWCNAFHWCLVQFWPLHWFVVFCFVYLCICIALMSMLELSLIGERTIFHIA